MKYKTNDDDDEISTLFLITLNSLYMREIWTIIRDYDEFLV